MSLFKRKPARSPDDGSPQSGDPDELTPDVSGSEPDGSGPDGSEPDNTGGRSPGRGPWDATEVEGPGDRLDVGSLWLPLVDGVELQLQLDEATGQVTGVFVVLEQSAVQLQAFAAPRREGIWREIREEIAAGITEQGGTADVVPGPFGDELMARVPGTQPDGKVGFQPLRFTGIDGPRWLLRAVFHGRAAIDPDAAQALEALVADVVVVRGSEPMGPRELLPLHLPAAAVDAEGAVLGTEEAPTRMADLSPFERGPEITERR